MNTLHSETTISSYNKNAESYAAKFMDFESYRKRIGYFQKQYLSPSSTILDLGCGPGNNAGFLYSRDNTYKITGIDLSEKMIELAKANAPDCEFEVQDIRQIQSDKTYDAILASFCIVHLSDSEMVGLIERISELLIDSGSLYLSFMEGKERGFEETSFSKDKIYFNYFDRFEIRKRLSENNLKTMEIFEDDYQEEDGSITTDIFIYAKKE